MQSGKILPIIRQFFATPVSTKRSTDSDAGGKNPYEQPQREPTEEEALAALALLREEEEFLKSGLRAELTKEEGQLVILVSRSDGVQVRSIRGFEIVRLLQTSFPAGAKGKQLGRILDRRV